MSSRVWSYVMDFSIAVWNLVCPMPKTDSKSVSHAEVYREVLEECLQSPLGREHSDHLRPSRTHLVEIAELARVLPVGGRLLDVGTGYGIVPRVMQRLGASVVSVDFPSAGGIDALKRLIDLGIEGHYLQVGVDTLPLEDASVDVVFVGNVIEHLPHSPRPFMADLKRVLKPGGHLVMDTKNAVDLKTRLKMLAGISNWPVLEGIYEPEMNIHHHKEYTLGELKQLFEFAGFRNIHGFAFEQFFHQSLRKLGSLRALGRGDNREGLSEFGSGFNPFHPYEYARMIFLFITKLSSNNRSDIMVVGEK